MIPTSVMMKLATIGLSAEQAEAVASMLSEVEAATKSESEAVVEKSRTKARERVQRWREKNAGNVTERNETQRNGLRGGDARGDEKQNNLEIPNPKKDNSSAKPRVDQQAFRAKLSSILDAPRIDALCAVRRKKGATFSEHAGTLLVKALTACPSVVEAADEMILRNWTSVKPEWLEATRRSNQQAPPAMTDHQKRHQAAINAFARHGKPQGDHIDDEFAGSTIDLAERDYRSH